MVSLEQYFTIDQENELVVKSLDILKDAKLRKQGENKIAKKKQKLKLSLKDNPAKQIEIAKKKERQAKIEE